MVAHQATHQTCSFDEILKNIAQTIIHYYIYLLGLHFSLSDYNLVTSRLKQLCTGKVVVRQIINA
jgi:hypothetical protein